MHADTLCGELPPMSLQNQTVLDALLESQAVPCQLLSVTIPLGDLVHVAGSQEPVRDQPDDRARSLLALGWLAIEYVDVSVLAEHREAKVDALQKAARAWLKQAPPTASDDDLEQARWMIEKTRSHESKQQIVQRVWLAVALYGLGLRGLHFDAEGQIHWTGGMTGRIGLAPDVLVDLAWAQPGHQIFAASFRQADGIVARGKGRQRWHIYRLTLDPTAALLFDQHQNKVRRRVALIVASQAYATQPQLPRDFYGGNAFQQACIDAQDQQFDHILVLSPKHGVISLDDTVPEEMSWDEMLERRIWSWQFRTLQKLGYHLLEVPQIKLSHAEQIGWWAWFNPDSVYEFTLFGSGFAVQVLMDHLVQSSERQPGRWPVVKLADRRPGYDVGDFDHGYDLGFDPSSDKTPPWEDIELDIEHLMDLANEFVGVINVFVPPTGETWELEPDEALLPLRLLTHSSMDIEDLLDLLTDIMLLLEQALPISLVINANMVVSVLLQITHSLVHNERDPISDMLSVFQEPVMQQYVEKALQETQQENLLCACLTLAEQMQILALAIPAHVNDQLLMWLQTYLASRLRQRLLDTRNDLPNTNL